MFFYVQQLKAFKLFTLRGLKYRRETILCYSSTILFWMVFFFLYLSEINLVWKKMRIVYENRDLNSHGEKSWFTFLQESCSPTPQFQMKSDPLRPSAVRLSFHLPLGRVRLQGLLEQPWCVLSEFPSFIYLCSLQRANTTKPLSFFIISSPISMETSRASPLNQSHVLDLRICTSLSPNAAGALSVLF